MFRSSHQRKIKEISPRSKPEIRKTKKSGDLRSTLSHKQGLEGYVTSVNQAHSKKDGPKVSSSTLDQNQHAQASKSAPEKKSAPSKPAAKVRLYSFILKLVLNNSITSLLPVTLFLLNLTWSLIF